VKWYHFGTKNLKVESESYNFCEASIKNQKTLNNVESSLFESSILLKQKQILKVQNFVERRKCSEHANLSKLENFVTPANLVIFGGKFTKKVQKIDMNRKFCESSKLYETSKKY